MRLLLLHMMYVSQKSETDQWGMSSISLCCNAHSLFLVDIFFGGTPCTMKCSFVFQTIMKDKWMNMGHEEEELLPYKEPTLDISDQKRIEILIGMGYPRQEIEESLRLHKFDDCYASYLLLGRKSTDVSFLLAWRICPLGTWVDILSSEISLTWSSILLFLTRTTTTIFACKSVVATLKEFIVVSYCRNARE